MSGRIIIPPGVKSTKDTAPEPSAELTRGTVMEMLGQDEAAALEALPSSQEHLAYTRLRISRSVFGIATASLPPTMHPEYELITLWHRTGEADTWRMKERWIREPGTVKPLARLDGSFNILHDDER